MHTTRVLSAVLVTIAALNQVQPADALLGVIVDGVGFISSIVTIAGIFGGGSNNPPSSKTRVLVKPGYPISTAKFPYLGVTDRHGNNLVAWQQKGPMLKSGGSELTDVSTAKNGDHHTLGLLAGDAIGSRHNAHEFNYYRSSNCLTGFTMIPDPRYGSNQDYTLTADAIRYAHPSAPWYHSGQFYHVFQMENGKCVRSEAEHACVWHSGFDISEGTPSIQEIQINNIMDYRDDVKKGNADEAKKLIKLFYSGLGSTNSARGPGDFLGAFMNRYGMSYDQPGIRAASTDGSNSTKVTPIGASVNMFKDATMVDTDLSAADLCTSPYSAGYSFVSERERLYCDMVNKILYPECSVTVINMCYLIVNGEVELRTGGPNRPTNGRVPPKRSPIKRFPRTLKARAANYNPCTPSDEHNSLKIVVEQTLVDGQVMSQSQRDALGNMLGRMHGDSMSKMSGSYQAGGGTARFYCRSMVQGSQVNCHKCIAYATDNSWSLLRSGVTGSLILNCAELTYKMNGGGSGGDSQSCAGLNTGHYGKGEGGGRTGDCCKDSDDCYSSCRSGQCDK